MDAHALLKELPEEPRPGLLEWTLRQHLNDLGGNLLVYRRESWIPDDWSCGWPGFEKQPVAHWAAHCTCTACGDSFFTGWLKGGGIVLAVGPDVEIMTLDTFLRSDLSEGEITEVQYTEGDETNCPSCGMSVRLTKAAALRNGRTHQIMIGSVENVGNYTAVLYWLVSRHFDADGDVSLEACPMYAAVIAENGSMKLFSHAKVGMYGKMIPDEHWKEQRTFRDPFQRRYHNHGSVNNTLMGGHMWRNVPDQTGQSGEKTGLADYVNNKGQWPALYMRFWHKHRSIENLVKAGWVRCIDETIDDWVDCAISSGGYTNYPQPLENLADWTKARPHEMLGMSRQAVRRFKNWSAEVLELFRDMQQLLGLPAGDAELFDSYQKIYSGDALGRLRNWVRAADASLDFLKLDKYLFRQQTRDRNGIQTFMDYRNILAEIGAEPLTEIELWPPHLRAAHDRLAEERNAGLNNSYSDGFAAIAQKWGGLEWSDGRICAVIPRQNSELIQEGKKLCHCVGGYGQAHISGRIIVFIRHARRPERSWFTLNIDLTGKEPKEIQLHGYGNEHAHGRQLKIPPEVREFCNRWERDILAPVFREVKANDAQENRNRIREAVRV